MQGTEGAGKWHEVEWRGTIVLSLWKLLLQWEVKGGQWVMPQHQLSRESNKNCLSKHRQRRFQGQIPREHASELFYSFLWPCKAVDSVHSVFKSSPMQTMPRTPSLTVWPPLGKLEQMLQQKDRKKRWIKLGEKKMRVCDSFCVIISTKCRHQMIADRFQFN